MTEKLNLLHISRMPSEEIPLFTPRIPELRIDGENNTIPRICTATTLSHCIAAHPDVGFYLTDFLDMPFASPLEIEEKQYKELERGDIGFLVRVYHFEVGEEDAVTPDVLEGWGFLPDVQQTQEHWIMSPCEPVRVSYALVTGVETDSETGERVYQYTWHKSLSEFGTLIPYPSFKYLAGDLPDFQEREQGPFSKEEIEQMRKDDGWCFLDEVTRLSALA